VKADESEVLIVLKVIFIVEGKPGKVKTQKVG